MHEQREQHRVLDSVMGKVIAEMLHDEIARPFVQMHNSRFEIRSRIVEKAREYEYLQN